MRRAPLTPAVLRRPPPHGPHRRRRQQRPTLPRRHLLRPIEPAGRHRLTSITGYPTYAFYPTPLCTWGQWVTVTGSGFNAGYSQLYAWSKPGQSTPIPGCTFVNSTRLTCQLSPTGLLNGPCSVEVRADGAVSGVLSDALTFLPAPTLTNMQGCSGRYRHARRRLQPRPRHGSAVVAQRHHHRGAAAGRGYQREGVVSECEGQQWSVGAGVCAASGGGVRRRAVVVSAIDRTILFSSHRPNRFPTHLLTQPPTHCPNRLPSHCPSSIASHHAHILTHLQIHYLAYRPTH